MDLGTKTGKWNKLFTGWWEEKKKKNKVRFIISFKPPVHYHQENFCINLLSSSDSLISYACVGIVELLTHNAAAEEGPNNTKKRPNPQERPRDAASLRVSIGSLSAK